MFTKKKIFLYSIVLTITMLLVVICVAVLLKNKNFEKDYSINIALPSKNFYENNCGCSLEKILSYRNFITYELTNDGKKDKELFKKIQLAVRNIVSTNDSNNGIHVKFNAKTEYGNVIQILDICQMEKAPTYIVKDYDVWIMTGSNAELKKNCPCQHSSE